MTPLMHASRKGHDETVAFLLAAKGASAVNSNPQILTQDPVP